MTEEPGSGIGLAAFCHYISDEPLKPPARRQRAWAASFAHVLKGEATPAQRVGREPHGRDPPLLLSPFVLAELGSLRASEQPPA